MNRSHARTSIGLGSTDPRVRRGQGNAFNEAVQIGEGLETDRTGRVRVRFDVRNEQAGKFLGSDYRWGHPAVEGRIVPVLVTTDYEVKDSDGVIWGENASTAFAVTLPDAAANLGRTIEVKNMGAAVVTLTAAGSDTIDGSATQALNQYDSLTVLAGETGSGAEWGVR